MSPIIVLFYQALQTTSVVLNGGTCPPLNHIISISSNNKFEEKWVHKILTMSDSLYLPRLSSSKIQNRISRSHEYAGDSPEWYWRLSKKLPELWIRDAYEIKNHPTILEELEKSWEKYIDLGIIGSGDGAGRSARKYQQREALKKKYEKLPAEVRKAKELALARYEHFAIDGKTGELDYHVNPMDGKKKGEKGSKGTCTMM
jgi:hypothetical protein